MGMLSRLLGRTRTATVPTGTARTGRRPGRGRATAPAPAARGLGGVAKRLMGGRRTGL